MCYTVSLVTFDLYELETFNFLLCKTYIELELCLKFFLTAFLYIFFVEKLHKIFSTPQCQLTLWSFMFIKYPHETKPYANIPMRKYFSI